MKTNTNSVPVIETLWCDWTNDDMDGGEFAPVWCGWNGQQDETEKIEDCWICPACGTERELDKED